MGTNPTRRSFLRMATASAAAVEYARHSDAQQADASSVSEHKPLIIDAHVHLKHGNKDRTEYSPETIVRTMDAVGIDRSVVFAMSTTTARSIEMTDNAVKRFPQRLIPYVYALPNYERPVIEELEGTVQSGRFLGIKIHVGECTLAEYVLDPVLRLAGKQRVPCLIDCGGRIDEARRMAEAFPATRLVIAHLGKYLSTDAALADQFIALAEKCPNVFLDVSGVVMMDKIAQANSRLGSLRLVWGTDGPHEKPDTVTFARTELEKINTLAIGDADKENILSGSVRKMLALP